MKNQFSTLSSILQLNAEELRAKYLEDGYGTAMEKNRSLTRFITRQEFAKLIAYEEIFKKTSGVLGSIADCGVYLGGGLSTYANLSAALEPYNYQCKILGFDTFAGSSGHSDIDNLSSIDFSEQKYIANNLADLKRFIELFDMDRPINQIEKIKLITGDLSVTSKKYINDNPEVIFRIIHLSVNLYQPTLLALENFLPRLNKGGILVVHAMNFSTSPTLATIEALAKFGIKAPRFKTFDYYPNISYWVNED